MSLITIQLGQCGNQIGGQFYSTILQDIQSKNTQVSARANEQYIAESVERFFEKKSVKGRDEEIFEARSVMIDMETKVIAQTCQQAERSGQWRYPSGQQFCQKRGSGNNWANGFCFYGPQAENIVMDMIQREAEKCDHLGGFVILMSVAGGTGSGVGAYITRCIREAHPNAFILNQVVWPYCTGEVIVQNYNTLLTMSHLYRSSDAILIMNNDNLQEICSRRLHIKQVTFADMNKVIANAMASFLQPAHKHSSNQPIRSCFAEMFKQVAPHPDYKLLGMWNVPQVAEQVLPFNCDNWNGLLKYLRQMQLANSATDEGINWSVSTGDATTSGGIQFNRSLASLLILRGKDTAAADVSAFRDPKLYVPWMMPDHTVAVWQQGRAFCRYDKSAAIVSNSRQSAVTLNHTVQKAWDMFSAKAFFHQYRKFGLNEADFLDSFADLEQVASNYLQL